MKVVYIAGPFRASNAWEVAKNIRRAEHAAYEVAQCGAMPLCPHANTAHFDGTLTDDFWIAGTLELLHRCDAVMLVGGWEQSRGARAEKAEAELLGTPVFESSILLRQWIAQAEGRGA